MPALRRPRCGARAGGAGRAARDRRPRAARMGRRMTALSLGHLTFVDVAPPDLVDLASAADFGAVGLRLAPARDGEAPWPMLGDDAASPMLRETRRRLDA